MNRMETDAASIVDRTNHAVMLDRAIVPAARHRVLIAVLAVLLYRRMGHDYTADRGSWHV